MNAIANQIREGLFGSARPMDDGRLLVRWGKYFYIMEADELRWTQYWKAMYLAIQLGALIAIAVITGLWAQNAGQEHSWGVFYVALLVSALSMFVDNWLIGRSKRWKQSDDEYDRLAEAWDRMA